MSKIAAAGLKTEREPQLMRVCCIALVLSGAAVQVSSAQDGPHDITVPGISWRQIVDGEEIEWPIAPARSQRDTDDVITELLDWYRVNGYYGVVIDSVRIDSLDASVWVDRGDQVLIGEVILTGVRSLLPQQLLADFETRTGEVLDSRTLELDINAMLKRYEKSGFVLASAQIVRMAPSDDDGSRLDIVIHLDEGPRLELGSIEIEGGRRTTARFISRATGVKVGKPLIGFDPEEVRARLDATGLFTEVDSIRLAVDQNQQAIMKVNVTEAPPGAFDALLGYLPNASSSGGGSVVGDVNILLRHVLGGGRSFGFRFR